MRRPWVGGALAVLVALSAKTEARPRVSLWSEVPKSCAIWIPQVGLSSWYGTECQGNATASGEWFDMNGLTAAHLNLPFGTRIRVTNLRKGKSLVLRVNDRGPGIPRRMLDVSRVAAQRLGFLEAGLAWVRIEIVSYPKLRARCTETKAAQESLEVSVGRVSCTSLVYGTKSELHLDHPEWPPHPAILVAHNFTKLLFGHELS